MHNVCSKLRKVREKANWEKTVFPIIETEREKLYLVSDSYITLAEDLPCVGHCFEHISCSILFNLYVNLMVGAILLPVL